MAALDFPANPTNGQVYGNWIYNSSKVAWQAKPMVSAKTVTSDVAPSSPANGDEWLNTVDGCLYIYYTDVDGSQWVQVKNDASFSSTLGPRVDALELFDTNVVGLKNITPTSVAVNSGSASIGSLGVVTFSGCAILRLNGVFTNKYKYYRILLRTIRAGDSSSIYFMKFASGGVDRNDSYAGGSRQFAIGSSTMANLNGGDGIYLANNYYAGLNQFSMDLRVDNVNVPYVVGMGQGSIVTDGTHTLFTGNNGYITADGVTFITSAGTQSGSVQVFGYNS